MGGHQGQAEKDEEIKKSKKTYAENVELQTFKHIKASAFIYKECIWEKKLTLGYK